MFLRKSRSSDALGNAKRSDTQSVRGGDTSKLKQKLNGKRSFRLFKSPKLGMPPEPSPKIVPSPPSQRLGSNGPSGTVHSAQGLGIKHAQGPDAENLSRPSLNYTRPIPHARMYNAQDAMSTSDMFSTSRPPGMGMRLPPSRKKVHGPRLTLSTCAPPIHYLHPTSRCTTKLPHTLPSSKSMLCPRLHRPLRVSRFHRFLPFLRQRCRNHRPNRATCIRPKLCMWGHHLSSL